MSMANATLLRRVLIVDAAVSGATAVLLALSGNALAGLLAVPEGLLRSAAAILIPFVLFVAYIARREVVPRTAVQTVIALNIAWVVASLWIVTGSALRPNTLGFTFIVAQALAVAGFAVAQYVGLQKARPRRALSGGD